MREVVLSGKIRKQPDGGAFSLHKPGLSGGPCEAGCRGSSLTQMEWTIMGEVGRLGWDEKFAERIVDLKDRIFKSGKCFSPAQEGQVDGINLNLKEGDMEVGLYICRFYAYLYAKSVSDKAKHPAIREIYDTVKEILPEMKLVTERTSDGKKDIVHLQGGIDHENGKKFGCTVTASLDVKISGRKTEEYNPNDVHAVGC